MGANTTVFVKVRKTYTEWIEVSAVTLQEAEDKAIELPNVLDVIYATYNQPKAKADE